MKEPRLPLLCLVVILAVCAATVAGEDAKATQTITFAKDSWDESQWAPLRLPHQASTLTFIQKPDCLGTKSFTKEESKQGLDNVLLMTDTNTTEGEFTVTFRIGPERGTAPGILLSPTYKDGVLETAICAFVADYTMAVWRAWIDPETGKTKYTHLVRLARWQDPSVKHVVRCRYSKKRRQIALQIDDSSVVVLRTPDHEINSRIGIWGCHGTCDYYSLTIAKDGALPWSGKAPEGK